MDPDELLRQILDLVQDHELAEITGRHFAAADTANRLCEKIDHLDEWMRKGGYLPDRWARAGAESHP